MNVDFASEILGLSSGTWSHVNWSDGKGAEILFSNYLIAHLTSKIILFWAAVVMTLFDVRPILPLKNLNEQLYNISIESLA